MLKLGTVHVLVCVLGVLYCTVDGVAKKVPWPVSPSDACFYLTGCNGGSGRGGAALVCDVRYTRQRLSEIWTADIVGYRQLPPVRR